MTKLKTRLPIKALSVLMAILMIFSTISIMFTVSAAVAANQGGGNGQWVDTSGTISYTGHSAFGSSSTRTGDAYYAVYLPEDYESYASKPTGKKLATLLVFSGGTASLNTNYYAMANTTGLNYLADEEGIIVIYLRQSSGFNSSYYWNWWQQSNVTRGNNYIGQRACELVANVQGTYANYVDTERTYVTGLSAGAAQASTMAAIYPDVFKGAAVVAGLPFKTVTNTSASSNYTSAYGAQGTQSATGWTNDVATLGGFITTAWTAAGRDASNATRVIIFHGTADTTVYPRNGKSIADANAYARYGANYSQKLTTVEGTGYTTYYYGIDQSMVEQGYSRDRAADIAFYEVDDLTHTWVSDTGYAQANYWQKHDSLDYNKLMWEFFEGELDYADAAPPVTPSGEKTAYASYGAKFCVQNGVSYADLVTAQGLEITDFPLSPDYLLANTDPTTASQWNFNFDLTDLIDEAKASNYNSEKEVYIESIMVYQNVWSDITGGEVGLSYAVIDSAVISQGGSNATPIASTTLLGEWEAEYLLDTYQFAGKINSPTDLDSILNYGYLSVVTYGVDGNTKFNVAAPIISVKFGLRDRNVDVPVEGDDRTARNSYPVFPVFAYNSAAGYNSATSAANETKTYGDKQGHLIGDAKKYAVGVYNAGEDNDTIYYSYNLFDYTKENGYSVQSITIKYVLEGNPYYNKEDVGVEFSVAGNVYWESSNAVPDAEKFKVVENITLAKDERVEGELTISFSENEHKSIINHINNLGGFTLALTNTSSNSHYYFLTTVPTIIVNYENIPNTPESAITGIGVRFETDYDDFVSDDSLFETGEATVSNNTTIGSMNATSAYSSSSDNSTSSSGFSSATVTNVNATSNYRTVVSSYNIYQAAYDKVIAELEANYPGAYYSEVEFTVNSATLTLAAKESSSSATGSAYFYVHPSAQSSAITNGSQLTSSNGTQLLTFAPDETSSVSKTYELDLSEYNFSSDAQYLWLRGHGTSNGSYTKYYVEVNVPQITNLSISYTAKVSMEAPEEEYVPPVTGNTANDGYTEVDIGNAFTGGDTINITPNTAKIAVGSSYTQSTSSNRWTTKNAGDTLANGSYAYAIFLQYDLYTTMESGLSAYNQAYADITAQYPESQGYRITPTLVTSVTLSGSALNANTKTFKATAQSSIYTVYNNAMQSSSAKNFTSTSATSYTATLTDMPDLTSTNKYLTIYYGNTSTNGRLNSVPTATFTYEYEFKVERLVDPIVSVTSATDTAKRRTTFDITTTGPFTSVRILDANSNVVGTADASSVLDGGNRFFKIKIDSPVNTTTYTIEASTDGTNFDSRVATRTVDGVGELVDNTATGNTATFEEGEHYNVETDYYTDTRVVTSSTVDTIKTTLSKPVDGQIIGTNSKYYTNDMDDYFTGPNRSTGSPVANVPVDTTKAAFPVSLNGYAYVNYDVSSFFKQEKALKLVKEEVGEEEIINGVPTQVTTKTYTETVVSAIRVNAVHAQEGYIGGLASSYTVSGTSWVKAGNKWTSTDTPTGYQNLGGASVSSTTGNIGSSANLNDSQFAAAKVNGYVTIWVNNTGCDWYDYYKPSAWLLVNMPTIEVTVKTITYTEKHITETKDRNAYDSSTQTTTPKNEESSDTLVNAQNGYLYGVNGTSATNQSYDFWGNPSNDTGEHNFTTSSGKYRTSTTTSTNDFMALANVEMTSASLNNGSFAVTNQGSAYVDYDLSTYVDKVGATYTTDGGVSGTAIINGKPVSAIIETRQWTEYKIIGISFKSTTQAGFTGNSNAANEYNIGNSYYAVGYSDWSGTGYPSDSEDWYHIYTKNDIKITATEISDAKANGDSVANQLDSANLKKVLETKHLTVRVDNTGNSWNESYQGCAWTLVSTPDVVVHFVKSTWTEVISTSTEPNDEFAPKFEVYAQYRFLDSEGASLSKTKYLGSTEGYGAWGNITPYVVKNGQTTGEVSALFTSPVNAGDEPTKSVTIAKSSTDIENYVLKRAYIEDTGENVALIRPAGNGTYNLYTTIDSSVKTNDTYKIRVIFEYECKAEKPVDESEFVNVNLHAVFENFDANGNSQGELGRVTKSAFAQLTNGSYILSLDGIDIPYGNLVVNGQEVSAVSGTNRIYNFNNDRTTITLKNSSGTVVQSTTDADDCAITENNNKAKVYLDMAGDTPSRGDILVVTYNGDNTTKGGEIDVYLYYEATPEYNIGVTYEFDIVDNNGNSIADSKYSYSKQGTYSVGEIILPYEFLATSEAEVEQYSKVSLTVNGKSGEYKVSDFDISVESSGATVDESLKITDINGASPTVKVKYTLRLDVVTNVTVSHVYKLVYGGAYVGSVNRGGATEQLSAITGGKISAVLDDHLITYPSYGDYTASQFTPVSITSNNAELAFANYANGGFAATKVPYNTPNAAVTITYELEVHKLSVVEKFAQNGVVADDDVSTDLYIPVGSPYTFNSALPADYEPFGDGITLDKYTASTDDAILTNNKGGSVSFGVVALNYDMNVEILYDYATYAQAPLNVVHQFYKNGTLVGTKTVSNVATLTNDPSGTTSYTVTPLSGTVTGISGSISSATVDSSNYYANGMSSTNGNVSVAGYTVTYTNNNATGTQPAIDVVVRYDITDTASVTVNHVYRVNGNVVSANVTNAPTTSLTLTKGVSQTITAAQGTVNYNGTTFNLSDFAKNATASDNDVFGIAGLNVTLNKFNAADGTVTVYYDLTVRTITVTEVFKNSVGTMGTETSTLYVANGKSYTFTSAYNSYGGIAISNFNKSISNGYTLGAGDVATFTATASADANVTITYTVGTQASVTVNHEYYINGTKVTPSVTNSPTTSLTLTTGGSAAITVATGTVDYNGTTFDLSDFAKTASTSSAGFTVGGLNVTLNDYNVSTGTVTVRYELTVRTITVTEVFKNSAGTMGTETSTLYVANGKSYTFTSAYNSYDGIAISNFNKSISNGYTLGAGDVATFTATASADANVTITYTVGTQASVTVNHVYYINGTQITGTALNGVTPGTTSLAVDYGSSKTITKSTGTVVYNGTSFDLSKFTATASTTSDGISVAGFDVTLNKYNVSSGTVTVRYELTVREITVTEVFKNSTGTMGTHESVLYVADGDSYTFTSTYNSYDGIAILYFNKTITNGYTVTTGGMGCATFTATATTDADVTITYTVGTQANVTVNHEYYINGTKVTPSVTNSPTTSLTLNKGVSQTITKAQGTVTYNGTTFDLSKFEVTASASSNDFAVAGLDVTLDAYNVSSGTVTVRYELTVREITVTEVFKDSTSTLGTETSKLYVANGDSYTFTSAYTAYAGIAISNFSKTISGDYTVTTAGNGVATFTATASADANVTITYTVGTQASVTVNHEYYINGTKVTPNVTNSPTATLTLAKGVAQTITVATGTVNYNGTTFDLSKFEVTASASSNDFAVAGLDVTLNDYNVSTGTVTVRYDLTVYAVNVTENFVKDGDVVGTAAKTVYVKVGSEYTFTSYYATGSTISNVALGDYIRTATGAAVTTAGNGAATFTVNNAANVVITYTVTTKATADVEYVYIVNGQKVQPSDFANITEGASSMVLVYGQAASAPSSTGSYIITGDTYTLATDFTKTVTVTGDATAAGNDVTLNAYNVANGEIKVTVTYEITVSNEAAATIYHTYYINGTQLVGDAIANVTAGTSALNLVYGESQTIQKSTGTVLYNGTEFNLSQFDVTVDYNSDILSMNGFDVTLIKYNVGPQTITLRYDLTVYTVVVNENFYINGVEQTSNNVTNTYYVSAKDAALTAALVNGATTVNGIAVSNFIASATDNSDAIDGAITAGNYIATVNGSGIVTINYNVSTMANVNITSVFKVNGSEANIDLSNVTNATATMTGFEYGVSKEITSRAGGYVTWNGVKLDVSKFTATITYYDTETVSTNGLNVTLNKYNVDSTNIEVTYNIVVRSVTVTENFIKDDEVIETQNTIEWYPLDSDYTFVSKYGNDYTPDTHSIPLSNFIASSSDVTIVKNSNGFIEFAGTASDNANVVINYNITTKANATVTHKYYFNGEEITPVITTAGASNVELTYGVSTPITLTQGTYVFMGTTFNLSGAEITVTAEPAIIVANGANVTLNEYNETATDITVRYDLSTVVVNIIEKVVTTEGYETIIADNKFYMLDNEVFSSYTTQFSSVVVNGVTVTYNDCGSKTVTGAEGFGVVDTGSGFVITGQNAGQNATIVITYSGVKTTATVKLYQRYYYKNSLYAQGTSANGHYYVTIPGFALSVGDRIALSDENADLTFTEKGVTLTVNTTYFQMQDLKANGIDGHIEGNEFVIDYIAPNTAAETTVDLNYYIDLFADVNVVHEFYINGQLANEATISETVTSVVIAATSGYTGNYKIAQKTSGTITVGDKSYKIADFTVDDALIQTTGLTIKRSTVTNHTNKFAVQSYDYSTDERTVVIRYDILTTLESTDATVNSIYVNNGEFVGAISGSEVVNLKIGDVVANNTVKTVNGVEVTFAVQSVTANGITLTEENGVYTIIEIDPRAAEWTIDVVYSATATATVKLKHNFYVADKLLGTITDNAVMVNLANRNGKFVALNGIVGVTTDKGVVYVDASRFTVTLASGSEYGVFANDIYTLNSDAFNGSTYEIAFDYNIDGISYAIDGEVGVKQTASSINANGQYNVVTTVTSVGNLHPIDLIFVVDISEGAGDTSNEQLTNAKAEISEYITNSFALNDNVRVAIVTYADSYEILTGGYITDKDTALATVAGITLAKAKDGYDVTASNLQAGLYGARTLMNSDVRRAYTDVIVIKGSEPNAAYSKYNDASYNYSVKADSATADVANAAANYELDKMNASKVTVIDLTDVETDMDATMTELFDARNYINVNGEVYITINADEFTFVEANGVTVNGNAIEYTYREKDGLISIKNLGTLKGDIVIEYTVELKNKVDGDYFVSDEIKVAYVDSVDMEREIIHGVSARVNYNTTTAGSTITVITYLANSNLDPIGMNGLTVKNFYEDAIIGTPIVYAVSGITNLTAGTTYEVKAPNVSGYTLWGNEESVKAVVIPAEGDDAVVYFGYYASGALVDDSIVYDDATDMVFDVLTNDARPTGESFNAIYGIGATADEAISGNTAKVSTPAGEILILNEGNIRFTPHGITVTGEFYYAVQEGDEIRVGKIYVVPATIIKADITSAVQVQIGDRWTLVHEASDGVSEGSANAYIEDHDPDVVGLPTNKANTSGNLVAGKDYTFSVDPTTAGDGQWGYYASGDLTDGVKGGTSKEKDSQYVGWFGKTNETVFDLGITHKLTSIVVSYETYESNAIRTPQFTLSVSDDGVNYSVYKVYKPANQADGTRRAFDLELEIDSVLAGRYVKITTTPTYGGWIFLSEIEIYGSKDLALGSDYTVDTDGSYYNSSTTPNPYIDTNADRLTNGNRMTGDIDNNGIVNNSSVNYKGDYVRWVDATYIDVVVDLGAVMSVGKFSVFSVSGFYGYGPIENLEIYTSIDGKTFTRLYGQYHAQSCVMDGENSYDAEGNADVPSKVYSDVVSSGKLVSARYVKFRITPGSLGGFAAIDEVTVSAELVSSYEPTYENLLSGKDYTSTTGSTRPSNDGSHTANLTDGYAYHKSSTTQTWFGLRSDLVAAGTNFTTDANVVNDKAEMIFDLGDVYELTSARIHFRNTEKSAGGVPPKSVKLWVSVDGETYNRYVTFKVDATESTCYWSILRNIQGLTGRYIKIEIEMNSDKQNGGGGWVLLNEIEVYGKNAADYITSDKTPNDENDIYGGYEDDYSNNFWFDGSDALYANRRQDYIANGNVDGTDAQYTASFSFTGTGFDILSVIGKAGGYVTIKTRDSAGNIVSKASGNILTFADVDNIYQATIFTCTDLTLDTYTVEVIAQRTYLPRLGMTDTQVYIDSVRTYNPFADNRSDHYNELHDGAETETLKDIFAEGNLAVDTNGAGLFTKTGSLDINSFVNKATINAINIAEGQSLLFKLDEASARTTFQVEMAAIDSSATVEVYVNSKLVETFVIDTGVFAYYDFSGYIRENSTVKFTVTGGKLTFSKVRYKDAVLGEPDGEKYTTGALTNGTAPDGELMSDDYTVNTARLVKTSGTSRTITTLVYTSTNADSVIIYTNGYRIAPTSVTKKENSTGTQNLFMITYTLPDDVPAGNVSIDFYAFDSVSGHYSSNYKTAIYTLK